MKAVPIPTFGFSGRHGSMVFVVRGKTTYVRRYKKPHDPKTPAQHAHRLRFMEAVQAWRELSDEEKARYNKRAKRLGRTGYNLFVGEFLAGK